MCTRLRVSNFGLVLGYAGTVLREIFDALLLRIVVRLGIDDCYFLVGMNIIYIF